MNLSLILEKSVIGSPEEVKQCMEFLQRTSETNLPELLVELSHLVKNEVRNESVRRQACLQLKNLIFGTRNSESRLFLAKRWRDQTPQVRQLIKSNVVSSLGTETWRPSSVAVLLSALFCVELAFGDWHDAFIDLCKLIIDDSTIKEPALETISFITTDLDMAYIKQHSNLLLTAIVKGMSGENQFVQLAAVKALLATIPLFSKNFSTKNERDILMKVICECCHSSFIDVSVHSLKCLDVITTHFYLYLEEYTRDFLFPITLNAMRSENEQIVLQGIEFWSSICEAEIDLQMDDRVSEQYAKMAMPYIIMDILKNLKKDDEDVDTDGSWIPPKAASVCLTLLSVCCGEEILSHVLKFVDEFIRNPAWNIREAAVVAFGSVLKFSNNIDCYVSPVLPLLLNMCISDQSVAVRDSAVWVVGQICECVPSCALNEQFLHIIVQTLHGCLLKEDRVATNACYALSSLSLSACNAIKTPVPHTYALSCYYETLFNSIFTRCYKCDPLSDMLVVWYETLISLVINSAKDVQNVLTRYLPPLVEHLTNHSRAKGDEAIVRTQSLLCAVIKNILTRIPLETIDTKVLMCLLEVLLMVLASPDKHEAHEEVLSCLSSLVDAVGEGFACYLDRFTPLLMVTLNPDNDQDILAAAVTLVSDINTAVGPKFIPYATSISNSFWNIIMNNNTSDSLKAQILSTFGDIALSMGVHFVPMATVVLPTLQSAATATYDRDSPEGMKLLNQMHEACFQSYTGIVQGLASTNADLLRPHVPFILSFISNVSESWRDYEITVVEYMLGLLGDLLVSFRTETISVFDNPQVKGLLRERVLLNNLNTSKTISWIHKQLERGL